MCLTSAAKSSARPSRFGNGICEVRLSRMSSRIGPSIGVSDGPGAIVTTRMPFEARSRATGSVIPATPAFDAE